MSGVIAATTHLRRRALNLVAGAAATVVLLAASACGPSKSSGALSGGASATSGAPAAGIQRATSSDAPRDGHFSDPYRVGPPTTSSASPLVFSGTFSEIMTCTGQITPGCFTPSRIDVGLDRPLGDQVAAQGNEIRATKAHHITRGSDGSWQMVIAAVVAPKGSTGTGSKGGWNVILHARPTSGGDSSAMPTHWTADTLLVGSFDHKTPADYDGKYVSDGEQLYLVYERELSSKPNVFGLVAQPMDSYSKPSSAPPVTLLEPETVDGGLASENYFDQSQSGGFRLVEVGNIIKVDGKFLMLYSVGSFERPVYKIGVAWSDTLLPTNGSTYRKVRMRDTTGVWGRKGANEVDYLLQSQRKDWPNYAGASVQAPGVGSLVERDGNWYLFFAGYDPKEKQTGHNDTFEASHRQPYYVPVNLNIPSGTSVRKATDTELRSWITPRLSPN